MKSTSGIVLAGLAIVMAMSFSCKKNSGNTGTDGTATVPAVFTANYKTGVTLSSDGTTVTLKSNGTPEHVTPYWGVGHPKYEAQLPGHTLTPGIIGAQNYVMTVPVAPAVAATHEATSLGPIGMALNGVAIFNDREGGNIPLDPTTVLTFDRIGGHVGPGNAYHYHVNGDFTSKDDARLIGFLRDGFPIYGRKDTSGTYPANLDAYGGHVGVTQDYPGGAYHYHCSNVNYQSTGVYILKSGSYYGTKGTFTQ